MTNYFTPRTPIIHKIEQIETANTWQISIPPSIPSMWTSYMYGPLRTR